MTKGQTAPRTVTAGLRQRAWWILRNRKETTLPQLLSTLADGQEKDATSNLGKYLRALERAGIVSRAAKRVPGNDPTSNGHIRYLLQIDCGSSAPVYRVSQNAVYAPDTQTLYPMDTEVRNG
ncbi:hypothetical protein OYT1_ch1635 [Ferriphaselus amnicola]|uniref:Uncharacterized protein n=1 Tax=Ferriphaselus amnicola TaxID=1188319 RepID=A0A2Z6GCZ4_9PROT|nr:hypothetical protein [Ferriphaselus amnicola]BBE51182.1 hypothetical protein OYT1_ch1635 [Ferriphaselus amnicola]